MGSRSSLIAVAVGMCLAVGAGPARAALPPQGIYDQCSPALTVDGCVSHLDQIAAAGFKVVLNYTSWDASPQQLHAYADAAAARGMKIIWPLNHSVWRSDGPIADVYPRLASACGCVTSGRLLAYLAGLLRGDAATWGWYIGDELPVTDLPAVLMLNAQVKALDPSHPTLYIAYEHTGIAGANLTPFARAADTVGSAIYPYGTQADPSTQLSFVARLVRRVVGTARARAMVVQAFDWSQHPDEVSLPGGYPDEAQMRLERDTALEQADPSLLLWYSFADIQESGDPARHWRDLVGAAFGTAVTSTPTAAARRAHTKARQRRVSRRTRVRHRAQ